MKTRTAPWDHQRRYAMPPDDLFNICPACGYHLAVKNGELIDCHKCDTRNQQPLSAEELTKRANCQTCMISKDLRHCEDCAFKAYKYLHVGEQVALAYGVSDLSLNDMTPEQQNEWFSSVPEVEL